MEGVAKRLCWQTWLAFVVGVVASVATMPLVSHTFGIVTLWSIITGPLMILLCSILIGATMLYIVVGGLFGDIFGGRLTALVAEWTGGAMNAIAAWCSQHDALIFDIRLGTLLTVIIYLVLLLLTILRWSKIK
jgi:competence protein ComEC